MTTTAEFIAASKAKGSVRKRLLTCIVEDNAPLADSYAIKFAQQWHLEHILDDLKQQARLALIKAVESYKPIGLKKNRPGTHGEKHFANWFWFVCRDELQRCARHCGEDVHPHARSMRGKPRPKAVQIEDVSTTATGLGFATILGESGAHELLVAINELPPVERLIVQRLTEGDHRKDIARDLGIDDIDTLIETIREKLTT